MTDRAAESQGKALVVAEASRAFWTALGKGCTRVRQRQAVSGTSLDTGHRQHVLPREGVHGLGVGRAPEHDGVSTGTADHDGSGDPVPNPDHFKPPGESWLMLSTTKKAPGIPGNRQLWPAAGDAHLTDLSLHRDWSRPFLGSNREDLPPSRVRRVCGRAALI